MAKSSLALHSDQVTEIVRHIFRLKPRLKTMLPANLARVKTRLDRLHPEGRVRSTVDYDLLYQVGIILSRQPDAVTMSDLSKALDVPQSTATRIADWLVKSGYVKRLPDPEDRRIVRVALTRTGQQMYKTVNQFIQKRVEQLLSQFTADERESLVLLLRKLVEALEREGE